MEAKETDTNMPASETKDQICAKVTITEKEITIQQATDKKTPGRLNPKLSVFREFVLATAHLCAMEHRAKQSKTTEENGEGDTVRHQFFACDLIAQSGIAGLQWKKHIGKDIHVVLAEQRDPQLVQDNVENNCFSCLALPLDPSRPAGTPLPRQEATEVHLAKCDSSVLLQLEAFDFVYVDPHKNGAPYFSTLFRNVRNNGVVCIVVPDTLHFARSPHVARRCYGAHCMKTEYLKELAVRIVLATLATEAAKCNKGLTVLYAVCVEDFLLLCVRVLRGPKLADSMLLNIGHVLHCRICEDRAFYPDGMAPVDDPYSMLKCDCRKKVPGKTAVILGPLWKGSMYDYTCLTRLAASGRELHLTPSFFTLLQRVMEDCLCDTPPSLRNLQHGSDDASHPQAPSTNGIPPSTQGKEADAVEKRKDSRREESGDCLPEGLATSGASKTGENRSRDCGHLSPSTEGGTGSEAGKTDTGVVECHSVKRTAEEAGAVESPLMYKKVKTDLEPSPCFFYNIHSKRMAKNHIPKHHTIIERLRAKGYRCCRTHFEKYAVRTNADLKTLMDVLGTGENKVLYVKGHQADS